MGKAILSIAGITRKDASISDVLTIFRIDHTGLKESQINEKAYGSLRNITFKLGWNRRL
jgi:hypothetical protein